MAILLIVSPALAAQGVGVGDGDLTVGGDEAPQFVGVDETTALVYAVLAHCEGQEQFWGMNMNFPYPDTGQLTCDSLLELWHQYFWLCQHYDLNLVRIGAADSWATEIMHEAYLHEPARLMQVLEVMLHEAWEHGVYVSIVLAGSQEWPLYDFGGAGTVLDPTSTAYSRYLSYVSGMISLVESCPQANATFSIDVWNEPDHMTVDSAYWHGDQLRFKRWAQGISSAICPLTDINVEMGAGGAAGMWDWNLASFQNSTGLTGFDLAHRHYYASATDLYLVTDPLKWADACGLPLHWGELARNNVYPLQRWTWFESVLRSSGADAWCSMVLRGTPGYPYVGLIPQDVEPPPDDGGNDTVPPNPDNDTTPGNDTVPPNPNNDTTPGNDTLPEIPDGNGTAPGNDTDPEGDPGNDTEPTVPGEGEGPPGNDTSPPPGNGTTGGDDDGLTGERADVISQASSWLLPLLLISAVVLMVAVAHRALRRY